MRAPTPREWRFLIEPLAWAVLLPVIAATLGPPVAAGAAGVGLFLHLVAYLRAVQPGAADHGRQAVPADLLTPVEGRLRRLGRAADDAPDLARSMMLAAALLGRALARHHGEWAFLAVMLIGITAVGALTAIATAPGAELEDEPEISPPEGDRVS